MICLFCPPEMDRIKQVTDLLTWAAFRIEDELASDIDIRLAGVAARMAFEFHLRDLCRQRELPKGERWHNFAVRLLKAGVFTMAEYRHVRRIARLAAKAVHGKPFDIERARELLAKVVEFVEKTQ